MSGYKMLRAGSNGNKPKGDVVDLASARLLAKGCSDDIDNALRNGNQTYPVCGKSPPGLIDGDYCSIELEDDGQNNSRLCPKRGAPLYVTIRGQRTLFIDVTEQ